jgi:hypothetical protein
MGLLNGLSRCRQRYNTCQRIGEDKYCFCKAQVILEEEAKDYCKNCSHYVQGKWRCTDETE